MTEPTRITAPVRLDDLINAITTVHSEPLEQLATAVLTAEALGDLRNCQYLWIGVFQATSVPAC